MVSKSYEYYMGGFILYGKNVIVIFNNTDLCTWVSCGCPAENGIHGIPFTGCNTKLKGLLSTITMRSRSFDMQVRSFTCSLCSLQAYNIYKNAWNSSNRLHSKLQAQNHKIIVKFEKSFILIITQYQKNLQRNSMLSDNNFDL